MNPGPRMTNAPDRTAQARADMAACRAALREGSYTFYAASLILPPSIREPASALYAFCRLADDVVDNGHNPHAAVALLRRRLDLAYRPAPTGTGALHEFSEPVDRAMAALVQEFGIPRTLPEALLDGFEWDANGRRYETLEDVHDYAARVAGSVGAMMALLMGVRSPQGLARACDLGVAMQLSNIARDVGEDARMGRLYLPRQWLREAGVDPDLWLAQPEFTPAIASVVQRLLHAAEQLYVQVDAGVAELPLSCRPGINAARYLYAEIGREVARRGGDSVSQRAVVPRSRKAWLLAQAFVRLAPRSGAAPLACLNATRYLVEAAAQDTASASAQPRTGTSPGPHAGELAQVAEWWHLGKRAEQRATWVIDLFERLERRERLLGASPLMQAGRK